MTAEVQKVMSLLSAASFLLTGCELAAQRNQTVVVRFPDISGIDQNSPLLNPDQKAAFGVRALFMNASDNKAIYSMDLTEKPDTRVNEQEDAYAIIKDQLKLIDVDDIDLSPDKVSEDNFIPRLQIRTDNGDVYNIVEARFTTKDGHVLSFAFCSFQDKETGEIKWSTVGFAKRKDIEKLGDGHYNIKKYAVALQQGEPIDTIIFPVGSLDFAIISFVIGSNGELPGVSVGGEDYPFSQPVSQIEEVATFPSGGNSGDIFPDTTPSPTPTPRPTSTPTPMPQLTREDLKSMSGADKLKMAPQAESAPKDVVSSFAPGESAKDIAWSGKSLTFWDRVVAYEGTTKSGEKVTLYYDLESGRWAKQYADFDEVSKIPADEVAETMVIGGQLVKNKPAFVREWPDQTEKTLDGKMVFRDEHGNPLAVFDVEGGGWLAPEQAGVDFPLEIATEARADGKYPKYDVEKMGGIEKFMRLLVASEAQALREGKVVVDPQAVNYGWNRFQLYMANYGGPGIPMETKYFGPIYNVADSPKREPPYKVVSIGVINDRIFDKNLPNTEELLLGIAINNPNPSKDPDKTTVGILHIVIPKDSLQSFLDRYKSGVRAPLFMGEIPKQSTDLTIGPINDFQGGGDYKSGLLQSLVDESKEAVITPEMEEIIFYGVFN